MTRQYLSSSVFERDPPTLPKRLCCHRPSPEDPTATPTSHGGQLLLTCSAAGAGPHLSHLLPSARGPYSRPQTVPRDRRSRGVTATPMVTPTMTPTVTLQVPPTVILQVKFLPKISKRSPKKIFIFHDDSHGESHADSHARWFSRWIPQCMHCDSHDDSHADSHGDFSGDIHDDSQNDSHHDSYDLTWRSERI